MAVKIVLDPNPRGLFYVAGDVISGKVILESSSSKVLKKAFIRCFSKERVDMKNQTHRFFPKHTNFDLVQDLVESKQEIPAGVTSFAFSFTLPLTTQVAKLAPVRASTSSGTFKIQNGLEFFAEVDSFLGSNLECSIPIPIGPLWGAYMPPETKNMKPFEKNCEITRICNCFDQSSTAKLIFEGCPSVACWSGRISVPLKIKIRCPPDNQPQHVSLRFGSKTSVDMIFVDLKSTTYYSKSFPWDTVKNPIVNGYWTMDFVAKFEVSENELLSAIAYSWYRDYNWDIQVDFVKNGCINARFSPKFGISFPPGSFTPEQQVLSYLILEEPYRNTPITESLVKDVMKKIESEKTEEVAHETTTTSQAAPFPY